MPPRTRPNWKKLKPKLKRCSLPKPWAKARRMLAPKSELLPQPPPTLSAPAVRRIVTAAAVDSAVAVIAEEAAVASGARSRRTCL